MATIYDRKVLDSARRIANKEDAIQRDFLRHFKDSFVCDETHEEIARLMYSLPRRRRSDANQL